MDSAVALAELLRPQENSLSARRVGDAEKQVRVRVVEAYTRHKVGLESAKSAALALESAEAAFQVANARLDVGDVTANDQLRSREAVAEAAVALLRANAEAVNALETLAATVGLDPQATLELLNP